MAEKRWELAVDLHDLSFGPDIPVADEAAPLVEEVAVEALVEVLKSIPERTTHGLKNR